MSSDEWTIKTLREHLADLRIDDQRAIAAALSAAEKAVEKADQADQKHFETINERNREIDKLTATFIPRSEYDIQYKSLIDRIDTLTKAIDSKNEDMLKQIAQLNLLIVGSPDVRALQLNAAANRGQQTGVELSKTDFYRGLGIAIGGLTFIAAVIGLLFKTKVL